MSITVRAFDPTADRSALERLWAATLESVWPLDPDGLGVIRDGFVAERRGQVAGLVAVDGDSILLLVVAPSAQRTGIGSALHSTALELLRERGAERVSLGSGGEDHLWPGVPANLPAAVTFFQAHGWAWDYVAIDLVRDLRGYVDPIGAVAGAAGRGISLAVAGARNLPEVLAFEEAHFPEWLGFFRRGDSSVLAARDREGAIVGTLLFRGPGPVSRFWRLLGADSAAIACVGVAESAQGRGVGSALVARASELLRDAGARVCLIDWVVRTDFYRRVGFEPWREYLMATRELR
jgi:GNAT superfamily N-acetyltransferase